MRSLGLCLIAAGLGGCFNPDLGPNPFLCAKSGEPKCPEGYVCQTRLGAGVCVKEGAADAGLPKVEQRILTDAELEPSKVGPVYLDGAVAQPAGNCADKDVEPNNTGDTAYAITGQGSIPGWEICYPGDVDQYAFDLKMGQRFLVKVKFSNSKGDLDAALVDPQGQVIAESRGVTDEEILRYTSVEADGRYVLGVYGFGPVVNTYDLDLTISE
jgi:hypothetical protein